MKGLLLEESLILVIASFLPLLQNLLILKMRRLSCIRQWAPLTTFGLYSPSNLCVLYSGTLPLYLQWSAFDLPDVFPTARNFCLLWTCICIACLCISSTHFRMTWSRVHVRGPHLFAMRNPCLTLRGTLPLATPLVLARASYKYGDD